MTQPRVLRPAAFLPMRRTPILWAAVLLAAIALLLVPTVRAGQSATDARRARDTASTFLQAFGNGDRAGLANTVTQAAQQKLDGLSAFLPRKEQGSDFTTGDPKIENDLAEVPATLKAKNGDTTDTRLALVRENGQWRVRSLVFVLAPGGPTYTLNLEHPENAVSEGFRTLGQGMGMMARSMEAFAQGFRQGMGESAAPQTLAPHKDNNTSPRVE